MAWHGWHQHPKGLAEGPRHLLAPDVFDQLDALMVVVEAQIAYGVGKRVRVRRCRRATTTRKQSFGFTHAVPNMYQSEKRAVPSCNSTRK